MKKNKSTISIAIATYNEESNIIRFLDSVHKWVDEIVIADGNSQDNTTQLASSYKKVKIIKTTNKPIFHINKNIAIDACKSDWILQLDADEIVTKELKKEIFELLEKDPTSVEENGFWIKRKNYFLGSFLKKGGQYPDPTIRLYKNGTGRLPCIDVHEQAEVKGKTGWLKNDLEHYADTSFSRYFLRHNRYTTLLSQELYQSNLTINFFSFFNYYFIKPIWWFLKTYFRHKGFYDGFPGFVFCFYSSLRFPITYTKYWELKKTKRDIDMNQDWDKK